MVAEVAVCVRLCRGLGGLLQEFRQERMGRNTERGGYNKGTPFLSSRVQLRASPTCPDVRSCSPAGTQRSEHVSTTQQNALCTNVLNQSSQIQ